MLLLAMYTPFFQVHFREAKLPIHVQMESAVGGNSSPQILTESEHLITLILTVSCQGCT